MYNIKIIKFATWIEYELRVNNLYNEGWKIVKKELMSKLITIDSITSVPRDKKSNEEMLHEYGVREGVVSVVIEWINEMEGTAAQFKSNRELMKEVRGDSIVQYFE